MNRRLFLLAIFALSATAGTSRAELPSIRFDRLTPLGAAAGTTVEVEIAGADIEGLQRLLFDHPGLSSKLTTGKTNCFALSIAADVPPGTYDVRLVGRWGVSNPRLFAVTHGLADVAEREPNDAVEKAQQITVNSAVNGMSDGNGEDLFRFKAAKGQRVVLDCQAGKLDSQLDATMTLSTAARQPLASSSDYNGRDPLIDFLAPQDGEYLISVYDLSYRGGFPYRLLVTDKPHAENVWPRAVRAGETAQVTVLGRNLGSSATRSNWSIGDLALEETTIRIMPPADVLPRGAYRFLEHPSDHSVLPTAATCTLTGFQIRPIAGAPQLASLTAHTLLLANDAVTLEAEPNDEQKRPQKITLPLVLSGRFDRPRDADWFELSVEEAGPYALDVYCERINGRADPYLVVVDDQGNRITELDDYGIRINAFDGHLRDPSGMITLAAKRKYHVLVQDRYGRGGARFQYVLTIRKPRPDFNVAVIHSQNPGPGGTTIWRGGAAYLDLVVHHREGFAGNIELTADNLPPGVHAVPIVLANNAPGGAFVFWADANAADFAGPIRLMAKGKHGDKGEMLEREARPYTRVWSDQALNSSRPTRELVVAVRDSAPFALRFDPDRVEAIAGKTVPLKLRLTRHWADFGGDVNVLPLAFHGAFALANSKIAAGQEEVVLNLEVPAGRRPGAYTLSVLGQAQVPFSKDTTAARSPTLVSLPSRPMTIVIKNSTAK